MRERMKSGAALLHAGWFIAMRIAVFEIHR